MSLETHDPVSLRLAAFEGPLDLLLHLIRVNEVNIYDIPIVEITRQYDAYLILMRDLDLHVAGEYLVMAATLVHIKSRMLLPQPPAGAAPEEDPRDDLVRQLVEYETVKAAAEMLRGLEESRDEVFHRPGDPLATFDGASMLSVSLFDLLGALKRVMEAIDAARAVEIARDEISIAEKQVWLVETLAGGRPRVFQELIGSLGSRSEMIVAFLALLELIRLGRVRAAQAAVGGEILLMLGEGPATPALDGGAGESAGEGSDA